MIAATNTEPTRGVYINVPLVDWSLFTELMRKFGWQAEENLGILDEPIVTDDEGIIQLSPKMMEAVTKAELDYEQGKCLTEDALKQRFAQWL